MPTKNSNQPAIDCRGLTKTYGDIEALKPLDLVVPKGSVFGFLGRNGAGKTTTLRLLAGLAQPTAGSAFISGIEATRPNSPARARLGYLPQDPAFYNWMTPISYLDYAAKLFGMDGAARKTRIDEVLALAGLESAAKRRIGGFSGGMKQRLGIAQALIHRPDLLLLDEPTSALDPAGRHETLALIDQLRGDTTIFFSSHILADVERVCDTVAIIHEGELLLTADRDELLAQYAQNIVVLEATADSVPLLPAFVAALADVGWITAVSQTAVSPIPTIAITPTAVRSANQLLIATDAPLPPYTTLAADSSVRGLERDLLDAIAAEAGFDYDFAATPQEGLYDLVNAGAFDAVMAHLLITDNPPAGIVYSDPYLEVGQVMVVLADEKELLNAGAIGVETAVGVQKESHSLLVAQSTAAQIQPYDTVTAAFQALTNEEIDMVITDDYIAAAFVAQYPDQLMQVGETLASKAYGIAVAAANQPLLTRLNAAIAAVRAGGIDEEITAVYLLPATAIDAGESRVGTGEGELVIGLLGDVTSMDPATPPDLINWEVMNNVMGGLYTIDSDNNIVPLLAETMPVISADKLEYTIPLQQGLRFPDGRSFTAADVQWSINRGRGGLGGYLINQYLKDEDENGFADNDAVQIVDEFTVKFVLQEPTAYFPNVLATPPYFPISQDCYANVEDLNSSCGGIGPYRITSWAAGEQMRLEANPDWPGDAPIFANIQLRFYDNADLLRRSLVEFNSIDMAWTGLPYSEYVALSAQPEFTGWTGSAAFESYLVFEQSNPPWDIPQVRRAASLAVDRVALTAVFAGERTPLYSPVVDDVLGQVAAFPQRDLDQARNQLAQAGYSTAVPLPITLHYLNDGRYSDREEAYATAIKTQLEETGVFRVTLESASWDVYRNEIAQCNYPAYLLGWPAPGQPVDYLDPTSWMDFFIRDVRNAEDEPCNNYSSYESSAMGLLAERGLEEVQTVARLDIYRQQQELWATDVPTLPLLQSPRYAISLPTISGVQIDALGLMRYQFLDKEIVNN